MAWFLLIGFSRPCKQAMAMQHAIPVVATPAGLAGFEGSRSSSLWFGEGGGGGGEGNGYRYNGSFAIHQENGLRYKLFIATVNPLLPHLSLHEGPRVCA